MSKHNITILTVFIIFQTISCGGGSGGASTPEQNNTSSTNLVAGSWTIHWSDALHDGNPVNSENFIVFSEASSLTSREDVLISAEAAFTDIKIMLNVADSDFDFMPNWGSEKIHILSDYAQRNQIGLAYRDGIIIRAKDSPRYNGDSTNWQNILQHELTHVVEFLLIGDANFRQANAVWFREGFASYGARIHTIQTLEELNQWKADNLNVEGQGNPISIVVWDDFPSVVLNNATTITYYPFFELTVRYLTDSENGHGTTTSDVINFYNELGTGMPLDAAFELHFGITMQDFEDSWWELMSDYLSI